MSVTGFTQSTAERKVYLGGERLGGVTSVRVQMKRNYSYLPNYTGSYGTVVPEHIKFLIRIVRSTSLNQPVNWQIPAARKLRIAGDGEDWLYDVQWVSMTEQVEKNGRVESVVDLVADTRTVYVEG